MPSGYLVTLADGSLDAGDVISGGLITFTTQTTIGAGNWVWTGTWGGNTYTNTQEPGVYYQGTDGNVYFVPDYGPVDSLTSSTVISAPTFVTNTQDGIVEGTGEGELIDSSFTDEDGESVSTGADSIEAGGGDDTITAQGGADTVIAGAGNDVVNGGGGADLIYGDDVTPATPTSEVLSWTGQGSDGQDISGGFTQDTGEMLVGVSFSDTGNNNPNFRLETTSNGYVAPGESFHANSMLRLGGNGDSDTSTTTFSFSAATGSEMQDEVQNVSFRINDIDMGTHQDIITINAYDANGNPVSVTITVNGTDTLSGNTITAGSGGEQVGDQAGSALIEIAGPVQSIEIQYGNVQTGGQVIYVSDLLFDTIVQDPGNDSLSGGGGADTIFGQEGDDTLSGDNGNDSLDGGTGADSIAGGSGTDTLIGGDGNDTLAGGADGDSLVGGTGMDFLDYSTSDASVAIDLGLGTASGGHATGDTLGAGLDGIIGSDWNDTLTGYDGQGTDWTNVFYGGAGDDLMDGAAGDDSLYGGADNDTIIGGLGADVIDGGDGNDQLFVGAGDTVTGGAGDDIFIIDDTALGGGTITIDGGETDEPGGDTLNFSGQLTWADVTLTDTNPDALAGTATLGDGTTVNFSNIENLVICFTTGTRIWTPHGPRLIETLTPGDLVLTRDHGVQPIRWIGQRTVKGAGRFAPIRFAKGVLGNERELLVSPQHRMLHQSTAANLYFNDSEVLIPAKHMVNGTSIQQIETEEVTYVHMLFDSHEMVFAEGAVSESFHPGAMGLTAIDAPAREELFSLFPELRSNPNGYGDTTRLCLKAHEAQLLQAA